MKVIFLLLALGFYSSTGLAHSSEMFYQPLDGQTLVEGHLVFRSMDIGGGNDLSDLALDARVERGFSNVYSGYMELSYGDGELDRGAVTQDLSGLGMIHIGGQYQRHDDDLGRFLGTADLAIGLEKGDGENRTSGQMVLTLGVGYEKHMDHNLYGGHISYGVVATDYKTDFGDSAADGNINLKIYYERSVGESSMGPMIFAGKLAYEKAGFNYWQGSYADDLDYSNLVAGVYSRIPMSEKFHLLGGLDYRMSLSEPAGTDELSGFDVRLGGRMIF